MRLSHLHIKNYRRLVDVDLPLRPLTTIIGPNGVGKTSLLEIFQLLSSASDMKLQKFIEDQGGFTSIFSYAPAEPETRLELSLDIDGGNANSPAPMRYHFSLARESVGYRVADERLMRIADTDTVTPQIYLDAQDSSIRYFDSETNQLESPKRWSHRERELALAQAPRSYAEPEIVRFLLGEIYHYSRLDVSERAVVRLPQAITPAIRPGPNGENLYSALFSLRLHHRTIFDRISELLWQGFDGFQEIDFEIVGAGQVSLVWREQQHNQLLYPQQLSEGTLRFLWLITVLLAPAPPVMLLIDEPEVSLHPTLQQLLAALLQEAKLNTMIVVATHSPDLIGWLEPDEVLVADLEDGRSVFRWGDTLDLNDWLEDYTLRDLWLMGVMGGQP
ncbi:MAG: AAA family ATPase [Chloroflexota bacterium]